MSAWVNTFRSHCDSIDQLIFLIIVVLASQSKAMDKGMNVGKGMSMGKGSDTDMGKGADPDMGKGADPDMGKGADPGIGEAADPDMGKGADADARLAARDGTDARQPATHGLQPGLLHWANQAMDPARWSACGCCGEIAYDDGEDRMWWWDGEAWIKLICYECDAMLGNVHSAQVWLQKLFRTSNAVVGRERARFGDDVGVVAEKPQNGERKLHAHVLAA